MPKIAYTTCIRIKSISIRCPRVLWMNSLATCSKLHRTFDLASWVRFFKISCQNATSRSGWKARKIQFLTFPKQLSWIFEVKTRDWGCQISWSKRRQPSDNKRKAIEKGKKRPKCTKWILVLRNKIQINLKSKSKSKILFNNLSVHLCGEIF